MTDRDVLREHLSARSRESGRKKECSTVKCHSPATTTLRIESDYESVAGETRTVEFEKAYCDEHAQMWLSLDGVAGTRYEEVDHDAE